MIAKVSSTRSFGPLVAYLVRGSSGIDTERVAWVAARNLPNPDPDAAAVIMQETARKSSRVQFPVYHVSVSFDVSDNVTPEIMRGVGDQLLGDLGLWRHQALMVAHRDRPHAHVHLMVNRVHPDKGVAWPRWQDWPKIARTIRLAERALGFREVVSPLYALARPDERVPAPSTARERREEVRTGQPSLSGRLRTLLPKLRGTRSWTELEVCLAAHGLRLEQKGHGFVVTDGVKRIKASAVGGALSLRGLERRFNARRPTLSLAQQAVESVVGSGTVRVEGLQSALARYEAVALLGEKQYRAALDVMAARRWVGDVDLRSDSATGILHDRRTAVETERAHAWDAVDKAEARSRAVAEEIAQLPSLGRLAQAVAEAAHELTPPQLSTLHAASGTRFTSIVREGAREIAVGERDRAR
ncbi:MAG: hypothetical protein NVS4B3_05290 [Gemmatimonadaceae bacterium]